MNKTKFKNTAITVNKYTRINIDTVSMLVRFDEELDTSKTHSVTHHENGAISYVGKSISLKSRHGTSNPLTISHLHSIKCLRIEGSFYAHFYGQNAYTAPTLPSICIQTLKKVAKYLNLSTLATSKLLKAEIILERVDIAINFKFKNNTYVDRIIEQLAQQLLDHKKSYLFIPHSVTWKPDLGRRYEVQFYAKQKQMSATYEKSKALGRKSILPDFFKDVMNATAGILRVETRLKKRELKAQNMTSPADWCDISAAVKAFNTCFQRLPILNAPSKHELEKIALTIRERSLRRNFIAFSSGVNPDYLFGKSTKKNIKKKLRDLKIDCNSLSNLRKTPQLHTLLANPKRMHGADQSFIDAGIAPYYAPVNSVLDSEISAM